MASYNLPSTGGVHATLSGTTADAITVAGYGNQQSVDVAVINLSTSGGAIYARGDGTTAVGAATGTSVIEPGSYVVISVAQQTSGVGTLSVVGQNGYTYSCERA